MSHPAIDPAADAAADAAVADQEAARRAALEARRAAPVSRSFVTPPPVPSAASPFAMVSTGQRPTPAAPASGTITAQVPREDPPAAPPAPPAHQPAPHQPAWAEAPPAPISQHPEPGMLRRFPVEPPSPPAPPMPVVPPIGHFAEQSHPGTSGGLATMAPQTAPPYATAPPPYPAAPQPSPAAIEAPSDVPAEEVKTSRRDRRKGRKKGESAAPVVLVDARNDEEAIEAYRRFAREGANINIDDYYKGPEPEFAEEVAPPLIVAESLIPTGKPRRAPERDKPLWPKALLVLVLLGSAGGLGYHETHQSTATSTPEAVVAPVIVDQSTANTPATMTIDRVSTAGAPYTLTVPAGWTAESDPTREGGTHTDVTVTEPVLHLTVTVESAPVGAKVVPLAGTTVHTAIRIFGHPAGVENITPAAGSATSTRVATVTRQGVRYAITMTVPTATASHDFARVEVIAKGISATP